MSRHAKAVPHRPVRHDRLIQESVHDAYKAGLKYPEPTVCPQCEAVFQNGRWEWAARPLQSQEILCPACRRIHDEFPVGFVHVSGDYFMRHRDELMHLIENESVKEKSEHPLERVMDSTPEDGGVVVTTTGIHLARRLGEALQRACHGELSFHYNDAENLVRVYWHR
ncbi:MAG: hypothetical protein H6R10_658 [Rhodocyclaceae bacterium]|nr:hypothetical protein [Rhodocyclaceae bacterium]